MQSQFEGFLLHFYFVAKAKLSNWKAIFLHQSAKSKYTKQCKWFESRKEKKKMILNIVIGNIQYLDIQKNSHWNSMHLHTEQDAWPEHRPDLLQCFHSKKYFRSTFYDFDDNFLFKLQMTISQDIIKSFLQIWLWKKENNSKCITFTECIHSLEELRQRMHRIIIWSNTISTYNLNGKLLRRRKKKMRATDDTHTQMHVLVHIQSMKCEIVFVVRLLFSVAHSTTKNEFDCVCTTTMKTNHPSVDTTIRFLFRCCLTHYMILFVFFIWDRCLIVVYRYWFMLIRSRARFFSRSLSFVARVVILCSFCCCCQFLVCERQWWIRTLRKTNVWLTTSRFLRVGPVALFICFVNTCAASKIYLYTIIVQQKITTRRKPKTQK